MKIRKIKKKSKSITVETDEGMKIKKITKQIRKQK